MKNIFLILFLFTTFLVKAQHSCCSKSSTLAFAGLGADPEFVSSHLAPKPLNWEPAIGKMVNLKCPDGKESKVFEVKSGPSQAKVILIFHEWWGLNDYIKREAEKIHSETGYTVLVLDLYDGKVATDADQASKLMQGMNEDRTRAMISAAIDYAGKFGKIQTLGWCMGGGWSMQAALQAGPQCVGCVMYYGMPEKDKERISKLNAPVIGFFANKDKYISPAIVKQFQDDMKEAGKSLTVYQYDADHAFANPSNPVYDKKATDDAYPKMIAFIKQNFANKVPTPQPETK